MAVTRAHVTISGRVQGVGFRFSTVRQAERQGVAGWVRNLPDGRVEAVFEGQSEHVEKAVAWCRKGPAFAHVDDVQVDWEQGEAKYSEFRVHH